MIKFVKFIRSSIAIILLIIIVCLPIYNDKQLLNIDYNSVRSFLELLYFASGILMTITILFAAVSYRTSERQMSHDNLTKLTELFMKFNNTVIRQWKELSQRITEFDGTKYIALDQLDNIDKKRLREYVESNKNIMTDIIVLLNDIEVYAILFNSIYFDSLMVNKIIGSAFTDIVEGLKPFIIYLRVSKSNDCHEIIEFYKTIK